MDRIQSELAALTIVEMKKRDMKVIFLCIIVYTRDILSLYVPHYINCSESHA